jgi:hypothetical protein
MLKYNIFKKVNKRSTKAKIFIMLDLTFRQILNRLLRRRVGKVRTTVQQNASRLFEECSHELKKEFVGSDLGHLCLASVGFLGPGLCFIIVRGDDGVPRNEVSSFIMAKSMFGSYTRMPCCGVGVFFPCCL